MLKLETIAEQGFTLEEEIGFEGRNSHVFKSYYPAFKTYLVTKRIRKVDFSNIDEYFQEASIVYSINHPNVVPIQYACQDNEFIYLAMPYLKNGSLSSLMGKRFLTVREIIKYLNQIISGLSQIHSKSLIHFDIKPDNILLSDKNMAMISDFGLSRYINQYGLGKQDLVYLKHMPPEATENIHFSNSFDVYQLGMTIYRMCIGNTKFNHQFTYQTRGELCEAIIKRKFPSPDAYPPHIPMRLKKVISNCLHISPDERYQSVNDIMKDLASVKECWFDWVYEENNVLKKWSKIRKGSTITLEVDNNNVANAKKITSKGSRKITKCCGIPLKNNEIREFLRKY